MKLSKKDILKICEIEGRDVDAKSIGSCFGLADPREESCYSKGSPTCAFSKACLIWVSQLFGIKQDLKPIELLSKVVEMWESYGKEELDPKIKEKLEERMNQSTQMEKVELEDGAGDITPAVKMDDTKVPENEKKKEKAKDLTEFAAREVPSDVKPKSKKGTALYFAEEFWLRHQGTEEACAKYVEEKTGKSGKIAAGSIKAYGMYPFRIVEVDRGVFKMVPVNWIM